MAEAPAAPIIVSALFEAADQAWLDGLRRAHFPPERNHLAAHLTLFHHLPPSLGDELDHALDDATRGVATPQASAAGLMNLGRGVAIRVRAPGLEVIRGALAERFETVLIPQDRAAWRPHVTIQNKVEPARARALIESLGQAPVERPLALAGLAAWFYRGGPWELRRAFRFGRSLRRPDPRRRS